MRLDEWQGEVAVVTMTPENLALGNLLSDRIPFTVPIYQRAYAWEKEEIDDFVSDIKDLYEARKKGPGADHSHFFGGVVSVYSRVPGSRTGFLYELVDGQQRMATFISTLGLLMDAYVAIAERAESEGEKETSEAATAHLDVDSGNFLTYEEVIDGKKRKRLRLRLSRADALFFEKLVNNESPAAERASHERLIDARTRIRKNLVDPVVVTPVTAKEQLENLRDLLTAMTDDCFVIHIVSDDRNEAYRLFAILNDRGRSLTDGDLLRTRTLELLEARTEMQGEVDSYWNDILAGSSSEIDGFLRAFYASDIGKRAPSRDLFDVLTRQYLPFEYPVSDNEAKSIVDWVQQLRLENDLYLRLRSGQWPHEDPSASAWERDRLSCLVNVLGRAGDIPLLLSVAASKDESFFSEVVQLLERLDFRYLVVGGHAGTLAERYMVHAAEVRSEPGKYQLDRLAKDAGTFVLERSPEDLFRANLPEAVRYSRGAVQNRRTRHFLTTIDDFAAWVRGGSKGKPVADKVAAYDLNQIDIEHVYPQNPVTQDPDLDPLKHDVGNLTFWGPADNKAASNSDFATKKDFYEHSSVTMTRELAARDDWTSDQVESRREILVDAAAEVFRIET